MSKNTREKLLDAALDVFAEQGYQSATVQQIVKRAGVNIAAINYHFRDKASFYAEVVIYGLEQQCEEPPDFTNENTSPQQQLHAFIHWFLQRSLGVGETTLLDQIHMQEMMQPSPVLDKVVEKLIRPTHLKLREIVTRLLPEQASEDHIRYHCFSIIGQCNLYNLGKPIIMRLYPDMQLNEVKIEALVQHIVTVSLAGLAAETSHSPVSQPK